MTLERIREMIPEREIELEPQGSLFDRIRYEVPERDIVERLPPEPRE
jgi:hypothetical protein